MRNEHHTALVNQARAIRSCAQSLVDIAKKDVSLDNPTSLERIIISRELGEIQHNLNALLARFGRADQ